MRQEDRSRVAAVLAFAVTVLLVSSIILNRKADSLLKEVQQLQTECRGMRQAEAVQR